MLVDEKISARIDELINFGERVISTRRKAGANVIGDDRVDGQLVSQWATSSLSLLSRVFGEDSAHYKTFAKFVDGFVTYSLAFRALGVLKAAKDDYSNGHLSQIRRLIEAELFDDFLEQAEEIYAAGYFQPAAVIAGCVLEDGLRKLCQLSDIKLTSQPKLDQMNSDLAKAGVYSKLIQKRITALADLRNKAAHGQWDQFNQRDVEEMIAAVRRFMEEHCV